MNGWRLGVLLLSLASCACDASRSGAPEQTAAPSVAAPSVAAPSVAAPSETGRVRVAPEAIERSGIRLARVAAMPAGGGLTVAAEVVPEPDRQAHVSSVVAGQIARVDVSVGDRVERGQQLAVIRSVALGEARAEAARARANVEVAQANFRRQQELQREEIGAERYFLEAQGELRRAQAELSAAERALEVYGRGGSGSEVSLRSPIDGRVISRHATVGEVVAPGVTLFEVTDNSRVWVVGRVYQQDAPSVREGASALFTLQSDASRVHSGRLDYVAPALDERSRTLPVRVVFDNPDGELRPGSFGSLTIGAAEASRAQLPTVVVSAVQRLDAQPVVFVPGETAGEFVAVPVHVVARVGEFVQVEGGLEADAEYVARGAFVLKSELSRAQIADAH